MQANAFGARRDVNVKVRQATGANSTGGKQKKGLLHRFLPKKLSGSNKVKANEIVVEDLSEMLIPIIGRKLLAIFIHNLFTAQDCADFIAMSEKRGFKEAMVHGPDGKEVLATELRHGGRCIIDDEEFANAWFDRVMEVLESSPKLKEKFRHIRHIRGGTDNARKPRLEACGLNERLRFLRYLPGQYFLTHTDNAFVRDSSFGDREGERSHLTFLLYANEGFKGGETRFDGGSRYYDVIPRTGSVLIFDHDIMHRSTTIRSGRKYCCRTDVMYETIRAKERREKEGRELGI